MKRLNYMRYAPVAAVLGLCVLCAPVQAGGIKGRGKAEIKNNIRSLFTNLSKDYDRREWNLDCREKDPCEPRDNPCVPEPSSLLGGLAAGAGLCGIGLYQRRRNRQ